MKVKTDRQTIRLSSSYLGVMMFVSLIFSVIFYMTSSNALHVNTFQRQTPQVKRVGRQLPMLPAPAPTLQNQTAVIKRQLLVRLAFLNAGVLVVGVAASHYLARRTLRPIELAMNRQQQFFSDASHELKTPLSALHLRGEVALRNPKLTLREAKMVITSNVEQATKLERLSHDLLKLVRTSHTDSTLQVTSLSTAVADAVQQLSEAAWAKPIHVVTDVQDIEVYSDLRRLTQVIVILLDNAIKYSPPDTSVHIDAIYDKRAVQLRVKDEGPGVSSSDLPHIFERFYQGDHSRQREGFGLGLSIAKEITKQLHCVIEAKQSPQGAIFIIRIPVHATVDDV